MHLMALQSGSYFPRKWVRLGLDLVQGIHPRHKSMKPTLFSLDESEFGVWQFRSSLPSIDEISEGGDVISTWPLSLTVPSRPASPPALAISILLSAA